MRFPVLLAIAAAAVFAACGGDDGAGDGGNGNSEPATATQSPSPSPPAGLACELLDMADLESVLGEVINQQASEPDEFENCFAFVAGGEVVVDACEGCLTDEEFAAEVEASARGRSTEASPVADLGDEAHWVPAGDPGPNTGVLWVKSGDLAFSLWVKLTTYSSEAAAQADSIELANNMLATPAPSSPSATSADAG